MKNHIELMNLYWTSAGIFPGRAEISRFDFKDRVEASARAGFTGIGIWHTDLEHTLQYRTLKEMKRILDDHGIRHVELEFLNDWFLAGARRAEADSRKKRLFEASEMLHAKHIKVGDFYNSNCPMPHLIESFAALCAQAENYGATIGFEIMGCAVVNNLKDALTMVETAGAKNGGLIIDIYQVANLGLTYEEISQIPLPYLINVELNDGTLPGSADHDPSNRRFCGEGAYDVKGFINCVKNMGYSGPWGVEVISEKLAELPLKEMSTRAFHTTIAQFVDG
ncbi:MAG TPA: sugar phosphate isomerase/epimerase family protein [Anaerolineales bacterium]|nr:sugar phosphate isomerase/epimerase family protein [Anaerolineales bacterium]